MTWGLQDQSVLLCSCAMAFRSRIAIQEQQMLKGIRVPRCDVDAQKQQCCLAEIAITMFMPGDVLHGQSCATHWHLQALRNLAKVLCHDVLFQQQPMLYDYMVCSSTQIQPSASLLLTTKGPLILQPSTVDRLLSRSHHGLAISKAGFIQPFNSLKPSLDQAH